ncbi:MULTISPECIES: CaiB/BaiF CoA transferase family protein [Actinomadura]|uniref:Crotonobetainyl-CoA:carnitine CoA-transferase CaiB n=1 Tax=Actinomadura madurae TaxID=1993 RepID=A0A1I5A422_9ACTN|nr:CoA transferase [Actinomadura madurae]SFN57148.1 Crotonobetainyl-CoA:carnitine CoA-transferase CaiB [Actinomadura madurae]
MQERPLSGIRVLDLTNVLAGPYCSYQLMLLGAEVVKIEVPGQGDLARHLGPDPELNRGGLGASFLAQNAGKKSVELDLKDPADRADFASMVRGADVLLENFRAGVLDRLGFGWPRLRELNPRLVYCAISGFGQTGPMSQAPAYDQIIQGLSGMMSITGTKETAPLRVGFPVCDTIGGLAAALHIAAALAGRSRTGRGTFLDVSMLEAAVSAMGWAVSNYLVSGVAPEPMGTQNATAAPSGTFEAADGPLNIAANRQRQFETLCDLLDRPDLLDDPRFADREARKLHRDELTDELNLALRNRTAAEWEELLCAAGVPAARVTDVPQAVRLDQLDHRGFFTDLPFPDGSGRVLRVAGSGILHDGEALTPTAPPPTLGQQNDERASLMARWNGHDDDTVMNGTRREAP